MRQAGFRYRDQSAANSRGDAPRAPRVDNAIVKALARAFRWRKQLGTGEYATLVDLARAKGVPSYVSRILRLRAGHRPDDPRWAATGYTRTRSSDPITPNNKLREQ
jgi:hypothetical protein